MPQKSPFKASKRCFLGLAYYEGIPDLLRRYPRFTTKVSQIYYEGIPGFCGWDNIIIFDMK